MSDNDAVRLEEMAEHVTMTERRSMAAEREATDRYLAIYMADRVGAIFDARIAGVTRAGLFVRLAENGADGFIPASRLSDEYWVHDDRSAALVAQRSGQRYEMGMNVQVKLMEATPVNGGLLFSMQSPPRARRNDLKMPEREARSERSQPRPQAPSRWRRPPTRHPSLDASPAAAARASRATARTRSARADEAQTSRSIPMMIPRRWRPRKRAAAKSLERGRSARAKTRPT